MRAALFIYDISRTCRVAFWDILANNMIIYMLMNKKLLESRSRSSFHFLSRNMHAIYKSAYKC